MTKLSFFLFRDKDEKTLLRADETNITIVLHSAECGHRDDIGKFLWDMRGKTVCYLLSLCSDRIINTQFADHDKNRLETI